MTRNGAAPTALVRPHPGVVRRDGGVFDAATRTFHPLSAEPGRDAEVDATLLGLGRARVPLTAADRLRLLAMMVSTAPRAAAATLTASFRRRRPDGVLLPVIAAVAAAARLPALGMLVGFSTAAVATGSLVGEPWTLLPQALAGTAVCVLSLVCHESAHLSAMRLCARDTSIGAVGHSWLNVWIVGPRTPPRDIRITALAGPLAGAAACLALYAVGAPGWICLAVGAVHLVNLLPVTPDGKALFAPSRSV